MTSFSFQFDFRVKISKKDSPYLPFCLFCWVCNLVEREKKGNSLGLAIIILRYEEITGPSGKVRAT